MKIKEPVQSTFCDNGTIIDRTGSLAFITKVMRKKGKAASSVENLLGEFHRPHRMKTHDQRPHQLSVSRRKVRVALPCDCVPIPLPPPSSFLSGNTDLPRSFLSQPIGSPSISAKR